MNEITRLELELSDAQLHLENAKCYIQLNGVDYGTLALYFDARDRVNRISEKLAEARKKQ